jgi:hypothetical protein
MHQKNCVELLEYLCKAGLCSDFSMIVTSQSTDNWEHENKVASARRLENVPLDAPVHTPVPMVQHSTIHEGGELLDFRCYRPTSVLR